MSLGVEVPMSRPAPKSAVDLPPCPICLQQFRDPRVLMCGHSFCARCVVPLLIPRKVLSCPTCREPQEQFTNLGDIPKNYELAKVVEMFGEKMSTEELFEDQMVQQMALIMKPRQQRQQNRNHRHRSRSFAPHVHRSRPHHVVDWPLHGRMSNSSRQVESCPFTSGIDWLHLESHLRPWFFPRVTTRPLVQQTLGFTTANSDTIPVPLIFRIHRDCHPRSSDSQQMAHLSTAVSRTSSS